MSGETRLRACPLDARVLEDAETDFVVADVRSHIGEEDARRLAACWNACAGIPTEALEAGALDEALTLADVCTRCSEADGVEDLRAALRALGRLKP